MQDVNIIKNCIFNKLSAENGGGAYFKKDSDLHVKYSFFVSCSATEDGGGLFVECRSLFVKMSCFVECFSYRCFAFSHNGIEGCKMICDHAQSRNCYAIKKGGQTIMSTEKNAFVKNTNFSKSEAYHITSVLLHLAPYAAVSYSIFNDCKCSDGVVLQFHTNDYSTADHLILLNNNCPSSIATHSLVRAYKCNGYINNSILIGNIAPTIFSDKMQASFCYVSNNDAIEASIQNKLSSPLSIEFNSFVCIISKRKVIVDTVLKKLPYVLFIIIVYYK